MGVGVWCVMYVFIRVCCVEDGGGGGGGGGVGNWGRRVCVHACICMYVCIDQNTFQYISFFLFFSFLLLSPVPKWGEKGI